MAAFLLGVRFLLELALLFAAAFLGAQGGSSVQSQLAGALIVTAAVIVAWGLLLAPKRRAKLPLWVRVAIEVGLFVGASFGLAAAGHWGLGLLLLVAEIVVLGGLFRLGLPPGSEFPAE